MNRPDDGIDEFVKIGRFTFQIGDTIMGPRRRGCCFLGCRPGQGITATVMPPVMSANVFILYFKNKPQGLDKFGHDPTKELQ